MALSGTGGAFPPVAYFTNWWLNDMYSLLYFSDSLIRQPLPTLLAFVLPYLGQNQCSDETRNNRNSLDNL